MMMIPIVFFLFTVLTNCRGSDNSEIILTNIIFRHGDRTPVDPYPNDPYRNLSYWPEGWGQLTNEGKRGHYELGQWIRQRYKSLLPMEYNRDDILIQSTDVDRTLMSAYCNLAGLYEPVAGKNWDPNVRWQPIPVHTTPEIEDKLLAGKKPCPKYSQLLEIVKHSEPFKSLNEKNRNLYEFISRETGMKVKGLFHLETIYNTLFIENLKGLKLPNWTIGIYPDKMKYLAALSFTQNCFTPELARLRVGPLLKQIVTNMKEKSIGVLNPNRKAYIYSAHDTTVGNVLQALKVFDVQSPPYLSTVLIELRRLNNEYYVHIFYRNSSTLPLFEIVLPDCKAACPLDQFISIVSCLLPNDWEQECKLSVFDMIGASNDWGSIKVIAYVSTSILFVVFISLLFFLFSRRQDQRPSSQTYQSLNTESYT